MSNAHGLQVVGIAPGHLGKTSREDFPLMSYLRKQNLFASSAESDNAEESEPLPDAAELKRQNDERLEKILREARIQLQQKRSSAWQDPKSGESITGGSKPSGSGNLVLSGKNDKDTKVVEKPTEASGETNSGSESQPANVEDGEKAKSHSQQKGLGSDPTVTRQNAIERLRRMEWQRNKTDTVRSQVELHALPPKRDLAAEEADAASDDARGKSKGRNRRRSRQQQQLAEKPLLVVVPPPPPFPGAGSRPNEVSPFWRSSKSAQEDDRTPFPARVNVWLQKPGVELFPKQPITESELQKVDELASATEEKMIKMAVEASLITAEEEGTILLPQPQRSTKSTFVQPPPLENEDWEADIDDNANTERNTTDKLSKNDTEKQGYQQMVNSSNTNSENTFSETKNKIESVSSASKGYTDHTTVQSTVNYSRRVPRNDNHGTSWYQSTTKEKTIRGKGEGKARNFLYTEEKNCEKIVRWKKPIEESELSTDAHSKNSEDKFQPESVNDRKITGIYNNSRNALKESVPKERWRSDWKDRTNDFSSHNTAAGRKPEEASEQYISDVSSSRDHQAPKEQRVESKRRNRQGSLQSSEDESLRDSKKENDVAVDKCVSTETCVNVHNTHHRNNTNSLPNRENSKTAEEDNSVCNRAEGNLSNSNQNSFHNSFTNVHCKSANNRDLTVSSATHRHADLNAQANVNQRTAIWNSETGNNSHQYEERLRQERSSCNDRLQQPAQVLKREEVAAAEKAYDNRDTTGARARISSPPGLRGHEQQRNEQVSKERDSDSAAKQTSESKPPEQESSVDEFFRKYAQHNSSTGQAVRLPDGNLPMGAFRVGGSAPGLGMQPNCAQPPVIQGAAGVPAIHPTQIRVCGVPQMYQACGMLPDMGTALPYSGYAYVDGTGQRPLMENHTVLQNSSDCCPIATPQPNSRFGGNCSERPAVLPVTPSSQSPEGIYPNYGSCTFEGGQQAFTGSHLGNLLKSGGIPAYGSIAAAAMPVEVMMPGLGTTHPTGIPPPPGVFAYSAVTPLTGVSPPRCGQLQQGLVLQPLQVPQENIGDQQATPRQENSTSSNVQDPRGSQVYSGAAQGIPQVPQGGRMSQDTQVASGNGQTPSSQDSSHTVLNRSTKSQMPPGNVSNPNPATVYSSAQPNDMTAFLALHQNGIADPQDVTSIGMSQWPLCCFSQPDLTQLQGVPQMMNADGTMSHFPDMAHFGIPQPFKQPGTPLVDHIWYTGVPPMMPVHDRNNQTKQFNNIPDVRLDAQAAMVPQMRAAHGAQMPQFGPESQQLNEPSQIYFPGIGHVPTHTQLSTSSVSTVGQSSVPPGLPPQPQFPQGTVQQQMGFAPHAPGILHTGMSQNVNSLAAVGNTHRNVSAQAGAAGASKGRIGSETTIGDGQCADSKHVQKMSRGQTSQEGRFPFPADGNRPDVSYLAEKLRQSSLSQRGSGQGMQTTSAPQGTFQSVPSHPGSTPKAQLYYEKVQSLLCQPPDVVSRLLQQMHLNAGVAPVTDPSGGPAVGPQGFVVPPAAEVWPVVQNSQVVQERLHPGQSQGGFATSARGRGKGRGRLRDVDG